MASTHGKAEPGLASPEAFMAYLNRIKVSSKELPESSDKSEIIANKTLASRSTSTALIPTTSVKDNLSSEGIDHSDVETSHDTQGPPAATKATETFCYVPPHLRKKVSVSVVSLNDQKSTAGNSQKSPANIKAAVTSGYILPHLRKKELRPSASLINQVFTTDISQEPPASIKAAVISGYIPPHLRKKEWKPSASLTNQVSEMPNTHDDLISPQHAIAKRDENPPMLAADKKGSPADHVDAEPQTWLCEDFNQFMLLVPKTGTRSYNKRINNAAKVCLSEGPQKSVLTTSCKRSGHGDSKKPQESGRLAETIQDTIVTKASLTKIIAPVIDGTKLIENPGVVASKGTWKSLSSIESAKHVRRPSYQLALEAVSIHDSVVKGSDAAVRDPRMILGEDPLDIAEWHGRALGPPPIDWDDGRAVFHGDFVPTYIKVWAQDLPPVLLPLLRQDARGFTSGEYHVSLNQLVPPPHHDWTRPDLANSDNAFRQQAYSAKTQIVALVQRLKRRQQAFTKKANRPAVKQQYAMSEGRDHNVPTIKIYLRPADERDTKGVAAIYNQYTLNSIVPEDLQPVEEAHIRSLITKTVKARLPFIVAVLGNPPSHAFPTSFPGQASRDAIVGFAYVETSAGLSGATDRGTSRLTGKLHFYTDPSYLRKGIGRCLLDMILRCTTSVHAAKEGYEFFTTKQNPVYDRLIGNGPRRFHQLLVSRPFEVDKNNAEYLWMKQWLKQAFWFEEAGRLERVARSTSVGISSRFLDVVIFQLCASPSEVFGIVN